jgi:hypothetical protein
LRHFLAVCVRALEAPVELEFACTFGDHRARFGFLQVRTMAAFTAAVHLSWPDLEGPGVVVASDTVLGNGVCDRIHDIIFVKPAAFEPRLTPAMAIEIAAFNERLREEGRPYILIGMGRWGSSEPWLGIPVVWSQISNARAIVEVSDASIHVELSQGAHFFHNLSSFGVYYFSVRQSGRSRIDWDWLASLPVMEDTGHVRHVLAEDALRIEVDGRVGHGLILRREA